MMGMTGEMVTLIMMAFALSMDAFSASLGLGMLPLRKKRIFFIGVLIGLFHIILPLLGLIAGKMLSNTFGVIATISGGLLLIVLGIQMMMSLFRREERSSKVPAGWSLFVFALSVSLDSFSVGLTLGIYGSGAALVLICFGSMATLLTWSGILLGNKLKGIAGSYSEALGGCVLLLFGMKLLFPF